MRGSGSGRGQNWGGPNNGWGGMCIFLIDIFAVYKCFCDLISFNNLIINIDNI